MKTVHVIDWGRMTTQKITDMHEAVCIERDALRAENAELTEAMCHPTYEEENRLRAELAAMTSQRDAWKSVAEDQYGKFRAERYGEESDYPVEGALDAWASGRYPALAVPKPGEE